MYVPKVMLNFVYDDMEQLAVSDDFLWIMYANAETFRTAFIC